MTNNKNEDEVPLEWLKLKTDKGKIPDFVIKSEMEHVGNKFLRKFKENPFVPIGKCILKTMKILVYVIIIQS